MRLKTKLVLAATGLTFAIVLVLSALFVSELLRQRIEQTAAANDVLVHEVWLETRKAVETGLRASPPVDKSDAALHEAVVNAMVAARTMTGINGHTVVALPHDRLREVLQKYNRLAK